MANEIKYLSYEGLEYFWKNKLKPEIEDDEEVIASSLVDLDTRLKSHTHTQYAPTSHTHTKSQITDMPRSLPNPQPLYIVGSSRIATYDGSATITATITAANIGALPLGGGTMTGTIKSRSIIPTTTHTTTVTGYIIGSPTQQFNTIYTRYIDTVSGYNLRLKAGGTEYINILSGNVNTTANIIPTVNNKYSLGGASYKWSSIYGSSIYASKVYINGNSGTGTGYILCDTTSNIYFGANNTTAIVCDCSSTNTPIVRPSTTFNGIANLGSSSTKWGNVYATMFNGNISMTGGTTNAYRDILVTNGSNGICYSSAGNVQLNYATGDVKATSFTENNTSLANKYAAKSHTHTQYAPTSHTHTSYASSTHTHTTVNLSTASNSSYYPVVFTNSTSATSSASLYIDNSTGTASNSKGIRYNPSSDACYCSGGFYEASDERLKNFGDDIEVDLDKLSKLSKKYFTWKDDESNTQHIGVSAQEVQELYPELVNAIDEEGHLSVSYDKLSVVALKGIDVLNDKIKSLEERLERLEKLIKE